MLAATGDARLSGLAETLEKTEPEVSVRLNPLKDGGHVGVTSLADGRVDWWNGGIYLRTRPKFTFDPALHQGRYYVQDASSMVMAAVARAIATIVAGENNRADGSGEKAAAGAVPLLWLDACAAPGGKTTAALDGLPPGSLVVANEYDYARAEILKENVAKWGNPNTVVSRGDTAQFRDLEDTFDVIAVDAPCSGEGMMRKDLTAREQWTPSLVAECAIRQRKIIDNLWRALRPGGFLVYSTCTFNIVENEQMVDWIRKEFGAESVDILSQLSGDAVEGRSGFGGTERCGEIALDGIDPTCAMRFIPGCVRGEGLFVAVLHKPGVFVPAVTALASGRRKDSGGKRGGRDSKALPPQIAREISSWIAHDISPLVAPPGAGGFAILQSPSGWRFFPAMWEPLLPVLIRRLQVVSAGVEAAVVKGKDIIPTQGLALSAILSKEAFPVVDVSEADALAYLSREAVGLSAGVPRGIVLLTFGGWALGFVKNLGGRCNNMYPKEWRIRAGVR